MKQIAKYQIIDHGIEHEQYFQGCGVAYTEFEEVATGIGDCFKEALEDALDSLAQNDWDTESVPVEYRRGETLKEEQTDSWYYVSVRVK